MLRGFQLFTGRWLELWYSFPLLMLDGASTSFPSPIIIITLELCIFRNKSKIVFITFWSKSYNVVNSFCISCLFFYRIIIMCFLCFHVWFWVSLIVIYNYNNLYNNICIILLGNLLISSVFCVCHRSALYADWPDNL